MDIFRHAPKVEVAEATALRAELAETLRRTLARYVA